MKNPALEQHREAVRARQQKAYYEKFMYHNYVQEYLNRVDCKGCFVHRMEAKVYADDMLYAVNN